MVERKFVVTGFVLRSQKREILSKEFDTIVEGDEFIKRLNAELRESIPKFRWVRDLRVKRVQ